MEGKYGNEKYSKGGVLVDATIGVNNEQPSQYLEETYENITKNGISTRINKRDNQDYKSRKILDMGKYLVKQQEETEEYKDEDNQSDS